jgi:hypothetical protein
MQRQVADAPQVKPASNGPPAMEVRMRVHSLSAGEWGKTRAIGLAVAVVTGGVMFLGMKTDVSPLPKPVGLAFAETLLGSGLPLPIGLLFHAVWVMLFSALYVVLFRDGLTFMRAFWLAFALWLLTLVFFYPAVGWGFFGLFVTPMLIVAAAVPHLLFAFVLWGLCKLFLSEKHEPKTGHSLP